MIARGIACASLVVLAGCPAHLDRNAPGHIDVMKPPARIDLQRTEAPSDPGEEIVLVSLGALGGVGVRVNGDGRLAAEGGIEASVHWGGLERSHERGTLFPPIVIPEQRKGINVGWIFYEPSPDDQDDAELGPLYVEWQESERLWGWAAGYSFDPQDRSHGPQATLSGFGYYGKASYRFGRGAELMIGIVMKWPQSIVWSR